MKTPGIVNAVGHIDDDLINDAAKIAKSSKKNVWLKWTSLAACFAVIMIAAAIAVPILSDEGNIVPSVNTSNPTTTISTAPDLNNEIINPPVTDDNSDPIVNTENEKPSVNIEYYTNHNNHTENTEPTVNSEYTEPVIHEQSGYVRRYFYKVDKGAFSTYIGGKVISEDKVGDKIADVTVTAGWETWAGRNLIEKDFTETLRAEVYSIDGISNDTAVALKFIDKGEAVTNTHYYVIMNPDADLTAVEDYIIPRVVYNNFGYETAGEVVMPE